MIIKIVEANTKINNLIAQHIINTSNAEYKEMIKMVNQSVDNNKQENKFKNVSDDEIYAELKHGGIELRNYDIVIIRFNF